MVTETQIGIAAGLAGSLFIGYCIYFDRKRRSAPDFRQKLRAKREAHRQQANQKNTKRTAFPNINDQQAMQEFFFQEVQRGEEFLQGGDAEAASDHLANAVVVCGQPQQLLGILKQTTPPSVYTMVVTKVPIISQQLAAASSNTTTNKLVEDELE